MYELVLIILIAISTLLAYMFACRLFSVNSMVCPSLYFNEALHSQKKASVFDLIQLLFNGLRDTESGYFARLSLLMSKAVSLESVKVQSALLTSKVSQCLIAASLFLPPKYFLLFLLVLVVSFLFSKCKASFHCAGIFLGLILLKSCVELVLHLLSLPTEVSFKELPGFLYMNFSQQHPWMFIITGLLFVPFTSNLSMILPLTLLFSATFNLTIYQLFMMLTGLFMGLSIKAYLLSIPSRGTYSVLLKDNSMFYFLFLLWTALAALATSLSYNDFLHRAVTADSLLYIAIFISGLALLTALSFNVMNSYVISVLDKSRFKKVHSEKILYKYPKTLFNETALGMNILMNELRRYSQKQEVYFEKTNEWFAGGLIDLNDIEKIHKSFLLRADELKTYLATLQKSSEITLYESDVLVCSKFLEGANTLENNFYEKSKLLELSQREKTIEEPSPFFSDLIESEDAVFFLYQSTLKSMDKEDINTLYKVLEHRGSVLQEIEKTYDNTRQDQVSEEKRQLALELAHFYQINIWQIKKQAELLEQWCDITNPEITSRNTLTG